MFIFLICLTVMAENAADLVINLVKKINQTENQSYLQHSLSHQHSVATGSVPATGLTGHWIRPHRAPAYSIREQWRAVQDR